jgi:ABC-2 type transport system permease protein
MTVFKGYMKITKRLFGMILMYMAIFTGVTIAMQSAARKTEVNNYSAEQLDIAVVDQDGGELAKGLVDFLEVNHHVEYMENNEGVMQEALYYETVDLIIRIPDGFEEKCLQDGEPLPVTTIPGTYNTIYVSQQINNFLNQIRTYEAAGYTVTEAVGKCQNQEESEVMLLSDSANKNGMPAYGYAMRYMPYLFLTALCYVLGLILASFRNREVQNRMMASAVSLRRQNGESILAFLVVGMAMWLFAVISVVILNGKDFLTDPNVGYYLMNSLLLMLVCLAISFVLGLLVNDPKVVNNIVTPLSLGMCFLCGAFVEMSFLGENVLRVSRFLPVYWYEMVNETLSNSITMTDTIRMTIYKGFGIQLLFVAALIGMALAVSKLKQQQK